MWAAPSQGARTPLRVVNCKLELNCVEFTLSLGSLLLPPPSIPITEVPSITLTDLLLVSLIPWIVFIFCLRCLGKHINPGWIWLKTWAAETKEQILQDYVCRWYYEFMFTTNEDPQYNLQPSFVSLVGSLSYSLKCWFLIFSIFLKALTPPVPSYSQ